MKIFNKKAISPLIATVLVIGFTIVLAGVVYTFILPLTTNATEKANADLALQNQCSGLATNLAVKSAKLDGAILKVVVDNPSSVPVQKLTVKVYDSAGNAISKIIGTDVISPLPAAQLLAGDLKTFSLTAEDRAGITGTINKVEVTPSVYLESTKEIKPCGTAVASATVY